MKSVCILFPGQGAQSVGMGRWLCEQYPTARRYFDQAAEVLGYDLAQLCFHGPEDKLNATEFSQPALFVTGIAAAEVAVLNAAVMIQTTRRYAECLRFILPCLPGMVSEPTPDHKARIADV